MPIPALYRQPPKYSLVVPRRQEVGGGLAPQTLATVCCVSGNITKRERVLYLLLGKMSAISLSLVRDNILVYESPDLVHLHRPNAVAGSNVKKVLCVWSVSEAAYTIFHDYSGV